MNPSRLKNLIYRCYKLFTLTVANTFCVPYIDGIHGGFWNYRTYLITHNKGRTLFYDAYLDHNCASIGLLSGFKTIPILPHGLHGIHISDGAVLGENITILQNVTIGSNTLKESKRNGAPYIGDNVFIGANSSIIGNIHIGNNCRIGANCCVFHDIDDNQTVVMGWVRTISHNTPKDNTFIYINALNSSQTNSSHN